MKTITELISDKGRQVWSVAPNSSVFSAIKLMDEKGVGALLVLEGERLSGIVSERDVARKVILREQDAHKMPVYEIMTSRVVCATPELTVKEAMAIMTDRRIRHLPVAEGNKVVGMISIGDLVKAIIEEQQYLIAQLETYITS